MTTTAERLRHEPDLWPLIDAKVNDVMLHIGDTLTAILTHPGLASLLEAKYREGEVLHERDWLSWTKPDRFVLESAEEIHDFVLYQAMMLVWLDAQDDATPIPRTPRKDELDGLVFG